MGWAMRLIDKLTAGARQEFTVVTEEGDEISLLLWYAASQQTWFFDVTSGDFVLQGAQLTVSLNILRAYNNILPFGFSVTSTDGEDPFYLDDFISGRIKLFLLSREDVDTIESDLFE